MDWQLGATELAAWIKSEDPPQLLDVRELEEHEIAHLPGARLIPVGQIPFRLAELADWKDRDIVVYCHHGVRSLHAVEFLRQAGFTRLKNLAGGIDAWSLEVDSSVPRY
ncbi:MAG: hypothetical protein H7X97_10080 [Opitutaceae bacterium]|nr:hypothetical protein [Verrucomicrobiales bacterium]